MQTTIAKPNFMAVLGTFVGATLVFAAVMAGADKLLPPGLPMWTSLQASVHLGPTTITWTRLIHLALGYPLFLFAFHQSWQATALKNSVEDRQRWTPTRLVESGAYAQVRHPMYGAWMMSNTALGFAVHSSYGVVFLLLSLVVFAFNGFVEERQQLVPMFGPAYLDYARRVKARYFTPSTAAYTFLLVGLSLTAFFL